MTIKEYRIDLARKILASHETSKTDWIPIRSNDKEFIKYKDDSIEIIAAKNSKALHVTIYRPLTSAESNPIIYVSDDGECYRCHGEGVYFEKYAQKLLEGDIGCENSM